MTYFSPQKTKEGGGFGVLMPHTYWYRPSRHDSKTVSALHLVELSWAGTKVLLGGRQ